MKRFIITILITVIVLMAGGYNTYTTKTMFYSHFGHATITVPKDSVKRLSNYDYYTINTVSGVADSAQSKPYNKGEVECAQTIYAGIVSVSGTPSVEVSYGVYRGPELGWLWVALDTLSSDGDYTEKNINDVNVVSWSQNKIADAWGIKLKELGAQKNKIWLRVIEKEQN